jgi:hypothetical protein
MLLIFFLQAIPALAEDVPVLKDGPWVVSLTLERNVNSHTSYEFGYDQGEEARPLLSRLEFPMNAWWGGIEARRSFSRWSLGGRASTTLSRHTDGLFIDTDWADRYDKTMLTDLGVINCRLEPSYQLWGDVDLKVSDRLGMPERLDIRPVVGIRWQQLNFMGFDLNQHSYSPPGSPDYYAPDSFSGDVIHFRQEYLQYFLGLRGAVDLGKPADRVRVRLFFLGYWAYVKGENEDHHLLREGDRFTFETTRGDAWYVSAGVQAYIGRGFSASLGMSHLRIWTSGSHRLWNAPTGEDETWDTGVNVWSNQTAIRFDLKYTF